MLQAEEVALLDEEWLELIILAKKSGLTISQIQLFLQKQESNEMN